jgi:hypothetical protein
MSDSSLTQSEINALLAGADHSKRNWNDLMGETEKSVAAAFHRKDSEQQIFIASMESVMKDLLKVKASITLYEKILAKAESDSLPKSIFQFSDLVKRLKHFIDPIIAKGYEIQVEQEIVQQEQQQEEPDNLDDEIPDDIPF